MPINQTLHRSVDMNLAVTTALAAADAAADYSTGLDTRGGSSGQPVNPNQNVDYRGNAAREEMNAVCIMEASVLNNAKYIRFALQDSDDNSSFADISGLTYIELQGVASNTNPETEFRWALPPATRRYIRSSCTVESGGGTLTGDNWLFAIVT